MTAPATFNNASRIIEFAMENASLLGEGAVPTSAQYAKYLQRLNDMVNLWQTQGLKLWLNQDLSVPLIANQARYQIGPSLDVNMVKPLRVLHESSYYLDTSSNRRPIYPLAWDDYNRLSNVVNPGAINSYFVNKQRDSLDVFFWQTPDTEAATGTAHLLIQRQITESVSLTDAMDFPREWFIALHWGLANEISVGQPREIVAKCEQMANGYRTALEDWDVEDAPTKFEPDPRSFHHYRSFR